MVSLVVPNAAICRIAWVQGTRSWLNVFGLTVLTNPPTFDQALANTLATAWGTALTNNAILSKMPTSTRFHALFIRDIRTANQPEFESAAQDLAGTGTGDALPLSLAAAVTLRTALAGRSFRGRTFFSGWDETQNDANGRIAAALNTALESLIGTFNTSLRANGLEIGVLSRPADAKTIPAKTTPARAGQVNSMTQVIARDTRWESQRRRTGRT